jgi:hypothetical protein
MDVCLLCLYVVLYCVGRGLCDRLITHPEESYRAYNGMCLRNLNKEEDKAQVWAVVPEGKKVAQLQRHFKFDLQVNSAGVGTQTEELATRALE